MASTIYTLFRNAIQREQQVTCIYDGRHRELCPHIVGTNKSGEEVVLAWQFAGESSGRLPQWRCLKLANVGDARVRDGRWYAGGSHKTSQKCVTEIDLETSLEPASSHPSEGRIAIVTDAGWDAMDAGGAFDESAGCGRRSRVVLTPRRWCQVSRKYPLGDGGKKARSPGRARSKPLKPLRRKCRVSR
jgi:hypothetical protein